MTCSPLSLGGKGVYAHLHRHGLPWTLEADGRSAQVTLPAHLDAHLRAEPMEYRLRTRAALPPELRRRALTLAITQLPAIATLRANGAEVRATQIGASARYRSTGALAFTVPASDADAIDLELVVEHRWARSGWIDSVPRLSATAHGDRTFLVSALNDGAATLAGGGAWLICVTYLFIFLLDRRRRAPGWFALEALSVVAYPAFLLGLTQPLFGALDVNVMLVSVSITCVASVQTAHAQYELGAPSRLWALSLAPLGWRRSRVDLRGAALPSPRARQAAHLERAAHADRAQRATWSAGCGCSAWRCWCAA